MPIFKKILKSQRGGKILIDQEGYLYNYLRETGKGSTWACRAKYKLNCYTRVYYCENSTSDHVEITVEHNHPPKLGEAKTIELMRKLKTGAKNSYKMRRELLKQLKCQDGIDLEQDLPTLLNNRKTRKRRSRISSSVSVELETEEQQENLIVDVDNYTPDISSTTDTQQEHSGMESEVTRINRDLQEALQKLMSEPDLLQDLVNTLLGPSKNNSAEAEQDTKTLENGDAEPSTTPCEERTLTPAQQQGQSLISAQQQGESLISAQQQGESLIPAQQQGQSLIPAQQQGESLIPVPFSGALTTRQTSVWTPPTYNTKPQLMRLAVPDTETNSPTEAPTSSTIVIPSSIDSSSEKLDASKNQPVNSFSENPPKVTLNSATVHCSTVSTLPEILVTTSASPQISRATTTATPDIAMATVTLPQIAMTSSGHPQIAMTSSGHPQIAMTSSGPHQIALTSPGIQQISMTSSGPPQIAMTTPVPQIVATLPVQPGKIVATVGQSSDNTLVAGRLVRVPETIISNDMLFKRMNEGGCTVYIAPPALKNPYCRQCKSSFSTAEQLDEHFNSLKCCEMCKMAFCVPEHYEKHVELNHPDGNKSAWGTLCETCGRVFGVMFQLDSHRIKCSNRVSLRCPRCFYSFGFEGDLVRHKLLHGNMVDVKCNSFVTENHQFRRSSSLNVPQHYQPGSEKCHNATETNLRPIGTTNSQAEKVCHFCTKAFPNQQKLLAHQSQHLDLNICKFCGISCQNQMELVEHERTSHMFKDNRNKT